MRSFVVAFAAIAFTVAIPSMAWAQSRNKSKEPNWEPYESELMNYKTAFPGKPKDVTKKPTSKAGDLIVHTTSLETRDLVYAITSTMYPEKLKDADPKKLLAAAKDALSANGGKIIDDHNEEMAGPNDSKIVGRDITVEFGKTRIRTRLLMAQLVLYQVSVTGTEKQLSNPLAGKFLSAFEVTK